MGRFLHPIYWIDAKATNIQSSSEQEKYSSLVLAIQAMLLRSSGVDVTTESVADKDLPGVCSKP